MDQISQQIVIIFSSGISFIMGMYMLILGSNASKDRSPIYWSIASFIIAVGLILNLLPTHYGFISSVVSTLFIAIGLYTYLAGIWHFKEKKINKWVCAGIPLFDILQSILFFYIIPSSRIRIFIHSLLLAVYCVISIYEMFNLNREQKYLKKIFLLNGLFFTIFLLFLGVRLLASFADSTSIFQRSNEGGALFYFIASFVMTALTFGFIGAVNLKLSRDLEEQLQSRMKFFAIIAHDLRGPVGNMMNFLSMMNTRSDLTEEKKQLFLDEMEKLSQSTYHLLQNLLEWASNSKNINRIEQEKIDVDELVGDNYSLFESQCYMKYIKLEYVKEFEGKAYILANKDMMDTVLRNLISNAIKFTNKEGHIRIVTKLENNRVRLTIEDNGVGILSETQDSIFSFNKSKSSVGTAGESGSGLGLAMCKDFVDMNLGELTVKSEVGKGSQFSIEFQVA